MSAPHVSNTLTLIDSEARRLVRLHAVAEIRLGQVFRALRQPLGQGKVFHELGFARFSTLAFERLGISGKTATRACELAEAVERFVLVKEAYIQGALEASKVRELAIFLKRHPEEEEVRVQEASRLSLRLLREELGQTVEPDCRVTRTYTLTGPQREVVLKAMDLACSIHGNELTDSEAIECVAADVLAGLPLPEAGVQLPSKRCPSTQGEAELERLWSGWDFLGARMDPIELLDGPLPQTAPELLEEAQALLATGRCWQVALGQLLIELERTSLVAFASLGHYAEERLGMSRSQAYALMYCERRMRLVPQLRQAVQEGRLTLPQLCILWPAIERGIKPAPWVEFAGRTTCEVLKRWVRYLLGRPRSEFEGWVDRAPNGARPPLEEHVQTLSSGPVREDVTRFRVTLEPQALRVVLLAEQAVSQAVDADLTREQCIVLLAEAFLSANSHQHRFRGKIKRLMLRQNCTCAAPGCTSRSNLHAHHIVFRSQGGTDDDENLIMLCVACHLRLVHNGYLKVRGTASRLVFERYGEKFLNEMRFSTIAGSAQD